MTTWLKKKLAWRQSPDQKKKKAEVPRTSTISKEEIDQPKQEKVELLDRIEELENKEPEIREVEVYRE